MGRTVGVNIHYSNEEFEAKVLFDFSLGCQSYNHESVQIASKKLIVLLPRPISTIGLLFI